MTDTNGAAQKVRLFYLLTYLVLNELQRLFHSSVKKIKVNFVTGSPQFHTELKHHSSFFRLIIIIDTGYWVLR